MSRTSKPAAASHPRRAAPLAVAPAVTVVLTVYRRTRYLPGALRSALAQSRDDIEVVVADDSASPDVAALCADVARADGRVRYRPSPRRLGVAPNLRAVAAETRGRYLAILNDDDEWEPDFLERMVDALDRDARCVLAFSDHWIMREDGALDPSASDANTHRYGRDALRPGPHPEPRGLVLLRNAVPVAMASVMRRDALPVERLVPEVRGAYDFWIAALLAGTGRPFHYVPRRLTRYRVHGAMETGRRAPDKSEPMVYIYRELLAWDAWAAWRSTLRRRLGQALYECAKDRLWFGEAARARALLGRAARHWPDPRVAAALGVSLLPRPVRRRLGVEGADAPRQATPAGS